MTTPTPIEELETALGAALESAELSGVLAAAWDAFDLVERVADAVTWDGGGDELEAMIAAQACSAGRRLLPLPEHGRPYDLPPVPPGAAALVPHVRLLRLVQAALDRVAATEAGEGRTVLEQAAGHARSGADALAAVRAQ
ncbi:hypothetical protein OG497_39035 [Streptomyces sp. NBC_01242]|uniref:hypothetical protein n=1 Tax=unclassified Streptomyces TaxID=2593676 RepID=UPI0022534A1A|nr:MULTISPECIES: hypothetical protein [unclassified Streptomyces]MCX4799841.1 hypothetical protein [Streptomyces sp. NBC_01242]WSJ41397.1 hypothetical protein OG772_37175 [Streptomyces sp. NBC_01321]